MEMDFKKYYKYITSEAIEQIEEKMRGLNAQEDMAYIVYFTDSVREEAEKLCGVLENQDMRCMLQRLPCSEGHLSKATRFAAVVDATQPIGESYSRFLDFIVSHPALHNNFVVLITGLEHVPSPSETKRNIRIVIEKKHINALVGVVFSDLNSAATAIMSIHTDMEELMDEFNNQSKQLMIIALNDALQRLKGELEICVNDRNKFIENKESIVVYANQLPLTMWIRIQKYCDEKLLSDVRNFAKEIMPELDMMVQQSNIDSIQFYFSPYLNYLWGQFLTNEMSLMRETLQKDLIKDMKQLEETYYEFIGETISLGAIAAEEVVTGAQPVSTDIEHYNLFFNYIFDGLLCYLIARYLFVVDVFTGGTFGNIVRQILNNLMNPLLRIKLSERKIRGMYSEAIYTQFNENVDEMAIRLKDYLVPSLERNFKESLQDVVDLVMSSLNEKLGIIEDCLIEKKRCILDIENILKEIK